MVLCKNRQVDQWDKIESRAIEPCVYSQQFFDKSTKAIQCRRDNVFQQIVLEPLDRHMQKKWTLTNTLYIYTNWLKMNHWAKYRTWNYKISKRKMREKPLWFGIRQRFLRYDTKIMIRKRKIKKCDFTNIQNFCPLFLFCILTQGHAYWF